MTVSNKSILYLSIIFVLSSCATNNSLRKPVFETTTYKGQTGDKEVTNGNKNRAEREKSLFLAMEKADAAQRIVEQQKAEMEKIDSTERVEDIELALVKIYERTELIIAELNETSPYSMSGHKRTLELAEELNNLLQNYIEPLKKMIESNKEVRKIGGDISFEPGSADLSKSGRKEISKLVNSMEDDKAMWEDYLTDHNANIFNDSVFKLMIVINGYADEQGSSNENDRKQKNKLLSEKRAQAVSDELMKQFKAQKSSADLIIDVEINGRGEMLPPEINAAQAKKNSAERRISRVSMVLGPKILLYN
jgi:outer membrane protein OmpA-like peptidoglycan-associated protein|tara:strand:+ start:2973 stop:3893 length:921 start_codon:yes stop_codon:yes gene_type:complete